MNPNMCKARKLRKLFEDNRVVRILGAHNALGAKLVEKAGFDGVWASGLEISTSHGVPDANILTMTDFLNAAISMNEAVNIPIVADCDTGFGNSNNVIHMVKKYEASGVAAVCIEDKHFPKMNSLVSGRQELSSISEFMGKILAAKNAQVDKDFMVIARVEALIAGWGMEEALKRANAYVDAGADAILIHSKLKTAAEIMEFAEKWKNRAPLVVVPTTYSSINIHELEKMKVKMVIYANHGIRTSISAMQDIFGKIYKEGSTASVENNIAPLQEVFELQGMNKLKNDEIIYSGSFNNKVVAVIPAAGDHLEEYSMKDISRDIPMSMLDINGKALLQRQVESLNKSGIYDIRIVAGYKKEEINVEGVKIIPNVCYKTRGILYSMMCGLEDINRPCLIIYGDILFDHFLINRILNTHKDITLILDNTYDNERLETKKKAELAVADVELKKAKRVLHHDNLYSIEKIGHCVKNTQTNLEFTGIMFLSKNGIKILKEKYLKYEKAFPKLALVDFLQKLIEAKQNLSCLIVNSGWMEIHSLEDYKSACAIFK